MPESPSMRPRATNIATITITATSMVATINHGRHSVPEGKRRLASPNPTPRASVRSRSDFLSASRMVDILMRANCLGARKQRRRTFVVLGQQDQGYLADD